MNGCAVGEILWFDNVLRIERIKSKKISTQSLMFFILMKGCAVG
jgi:hypothetical protein